MSEGSFPESSRTGWQSPLLQLQTLLVLAVLFGGGGVRYGLANLVVQLAALAVLAVNGRTIACFLASAPRGVLLLIFLTMTLPLVQLVPLPAAIWHNLPGRGPVIESLALAGLRVDDWRPLSLDPARTLVAATGLIAPATIVLLGVLLETREKRALAMTLVACAIAVFLIGTVQVTSGDGSLVFYEFESNRRVLYASFANRNSAGLFFVIALLLLAGSWRAGSRLAPWLAASLSGLLALGVVLTQSRSAMVLLLPAAAFAILRMLAEWRGRIAGPGVARSALVLALAAGLAIPGALALSGLQGGRAAEAMSRFGDTRTDRPQMWEDTVFAVQAYWPAGSGMGTFDEVFQLSESLEHVSPRTAGRAHSDWLEIALEAGPAAIAIALLWLGWTALALWRAAGTSHGWLAGAVSLSGASIAIQSLLDYPLRNQTLWCVAALLVVLIIPGRRVSSPGAGAGASS